MSRHDVKRSATDVPESRPKAQGALPVAQPSRAERARRTAYRGRFAVLYVILAAIAGAAIGTTVVLIGQGSPAPAPPWSDWQPEGSAQRRVAQIANHVASPYRLPSGAQLVSAVGGPLSAPAEDGTLARVRFILVGPQTTRGQQEADDVKSIDAAGTVSYVLCGVGGRSPCTIGEGTPSADRQALLRREALELALYTFKYVDGVDSVAVVLPPDNPNLPPIAVCLEKADVSSELSRPLAETFTAPIVPDVGGISADELTTIDQVTRPHLYSYQPSTAQDGSSMLVLIPALG